MGFISDLFGGGDDAAEEAAAVQAASADKAIASQERSLATVRSDLEPFRTAGAEQLPQVATGIDDVSGLVNDPARQAAFVQDNPFFKALADDAERRIFTNQAARGKVGSGDTAKALQNALLLTGTNLVGQNINQRQGVISQRQNLAALGANAAAGTATATQGINNQIGNLITGAGNAQAAGIVGAQNARNQGASNAANLALGIGGLVLSDRRAKTDIKKFGKSKDGINIYTYRYKGSATPQVGVMAQEVEKKNPDAVVTIEGVKHVNYEVLS